MEKQNIKTSLRIKFSGKYIRLSMLLLLILISLNSIDAINLKQENISYNAEKNSLFDIHLTIPKSYQEVEPGGELLVNVKLVNLGSGGRVDVILDFEIKCSSNMTLLAKKETVAVETQANFVRTFDIPKDAAVGKYKVYAKLIYADGKEAISEASFEIETSAYEKNENYLMYGIIAIISIALIIYLIPKFKKLAGNIILKWKIHSIVKNRLKNS